MSKSKGVSAEEKRTRLLQLFYEKKQFYQLKDLEKLAPKEKGIVANSVKDTLQNLVDSGLVDTDKIGLSVYFWAFPSKEKNSRKRKLNEIQTQLEESNKKLKQTEESIQKLSTSKQDENEKKKVIESITDLQIEKDELCNKLKKYKDNDPKALETKKASIQAVKDAANRWTDNIFSIKTWCKNKFNIEENTLNKQFAIPEDLDYIN